MSEVHLFPSASDTEAFSWRGEHEPQILPHHVVISGPMGVGKGTLIQRVRPWMYEQDASRGVQRAWSKSVTTRKWRPDDEMDAYEYVTEAEFHAAKDRGRFMEHSFHAGAHYATPVPSKHLAMLYEIEVNGFENLSSWLKVHRPNETIQGIFLLPTDAETLWSRLCEREDGIDRKKKISRFQRFITTELEKAIGLPYHFVINDNLDLAVAETQSALSGSFFCRSKEENSRLVESIRYDGLEILAKEAPDSQSC